MKNGNDLWAVEDAAEEVGVTRQRLNTLLRDDRYRCLEVPFRPARKDSSGNERTVRFRILTTAVVQKIKADRKAAAARQAEILATAEKNRKAKARRN